MCNIVYESSLCITRKQDPTSVLYGLSVMDLEHEFVIFHLHAVGAAFVFLGSRSARN